jgi:hypothetical protein
VEVGWRPYSNGYWQRTDAGWYWASDEPWGWATYHYGRWDFHPEFGWIWVPHTQWAPAWVCWREGGGYVGWAPLRPSLSIGVSIGSVDYEPTFAARAFVFVEHRRMLEPVRPKTVIVNNTKIINNTVNITKVNVVNQTVINEGPHTEVIERASGRKVRSVPVHEFRRKEEATVVSHERNIPTATARKAQSPLRAESHQARPPTDVPRGFRGIEKASVEDKPAEVAAEQARSPGPLVRSSREIEKARVEEKPAQVVAEQARSPGHLAHSSRVIEKAPVEDKPAEVVAPPAQPSPARAPLLPGRTEREKRSQEQKKREWAPAKTITPPQIEPAGKPEVKLEPAGPTQQDFHSFQKKTVAGKPESPPVTTSPAFDESRNNRSGDKRATAAPPSGELAPRIDTGLESKPEAKPPLKIEAALPAAERNQRSQIPAKEKARPAERVLSQKKAKEAKEQKNNNAEEQDSTTPPPGSPRQSR